MTNGNKKTVFVAMSGGVDPAEILSRFHGASSSG